MAIDRSKINAELKSIVNLFQIGKFDEVINKSLVLIKKVPNFSNLYNIIGSSYQQKNDYEKSKEFFLKAIKKDSNNIAAINNLGNTYKKLNRYNEAEESFARALKLDKNYVNALINLANHKSNFNNYDEAIKLYKEASKIKSKSEIIKYNLAIAQQNVGDFEGAIKTAKEILDLNSNFSLAHRVISTSKTYKSSSDEHLRIMESNSTNINLNDQDKINLNFAIGKAYEDIKNYEKSSYHIKTANKLKKSLLNFKLEKEIHFFNDVKNKFKNFEYAKFKTQNIQQKNIIFIVGMPRSGTTLVEQIISSHDNVYGAGELEFLRQIVSKKFIKKEVIDVDEINNSTFYELSAKYYNLISNFKFTEDNITDKMPLNFVWIGFIKAIFPTAKIVHCKRNPFDNCVSLFKNNFDGQYSWCYDEEDLSKFYEEYTKLMDFWKNQLGDFIYDLNYEKLVNDQENETIKLINFCGLQWDSKCLNFEKNKKPIKTASLNQARKSIYKTSISFKDRYSDFYSILAKRLNS